MKFFNWLKEEFSGHIGVFLGAVGLAIFCVIIFNVLMVMG